MEIVTDPYMYSSGEEDVVAESSLAVVGDAPPVVGLQEFQPLVPNPLTRLPDGRYWESKEHLFARLRKHMEPYGGPAICPELRTERQQEGMASWVAAEEGRCLAPDEVTSGTVVEDITDDHVTDNAERLRDWLLLQKRALDIYDMDQE